MDPDYGVGGGGFADLPGYARYYSSPQWPNNYYSGEATAQPYSPNQMPGTYPSTYGAPSETPSATPGGVSSGRGTGMPNAYPSSPWGSLAGMFGLGGATAGSPAPSWPWGNSAGIQSMTDRQRLAMGLMGARMMQPPQNPAPYGMIPQRSLPYGDALRMMSLMQPGAARSYSPYI